MATKWAKFPHASKAYAYDAAALKKSWARLHKGDCEPFPKDADVLAAWRHFHAGEFGQAVEIGKGAGGTGVNAAIKAQVVYASYLEKSDKAKLALLEEAAELAEARRAGAAAAQDPNAHYMYAFALGRYSQGISVAKALTQGYGGKIKDALLATLKLEPKHADGHTAYGAYQAEVIDKVGGIVAGVTYGARKDSAVEHYQKALELFPESPIVHIEYGNGLLMLFGKGRIAEATKLYEKAASLTPMDAMERLDVELAKSELE
jgi:tetratricopeptide (TPR) repeat protein